MAQRVVRWRDASLRLRLRQGVGRSLFEALRDVRHTGRHGWRAAVGSSGQEGRAVRLLAAAGRFGERWLTDWSAPSSAKVAAPRQAGSEGMGRGRSRWRPSAAAARAGPRPRAPRRPGFAECGRDPAAEHDHLRVEHVDQVGDLRRRGSGRCRGPPRPPPGRARPSPGQRGDGGRLVLRVQQRAVRAALLQVQHDAGRADVRLHAPVVAAAAGASVQDDRGVAPLMRRCCSRPGGARRPAPVRRPPRSRGSPPRRSRARARPRTTARPPRRHAADCPGRGGRRCTR